MDKECNFFAVIMQNFYMERYRLSEKLEKNILGGRFGIGTCLSYCDSLWDIIYFKFTSAAK